MSEAERVVQRQLDAYNAKDLEAWLSTYASTAEQYELHSGLLATGHEQIRQRMTARFQEPNLHAELLKRVVMGDIVIDHERVTRTFPDGPGIVEMLCIYEVEGSLIRKATFKLGARALVPQATKSARSDAKKSTIKVRAIEQRDRAQWEPLWAGYNAFYGRKGETALPTAVTNATWRRFFEPNEPVYALVAEDGDKLVGITHYLFHPSTSRAEGVCYLQDLFTDEAKRGRGIGKALIQGVYARAKARGVTRVYWQTQDSNRAGRALYDQVAQHAGFIIYSQDV